LGIRLTGDSGGKRIEWDNSHKESYEIIFFFKDS